ncbi:MAG: T9SS type A sorting domain-containing protein [Bacteroidales bacterium]|nr:T9SS type A sorting domain-containing protein [Bacteroidales bacterium]
MPVLTSISVAGGNAFFDNEVSSSATVLTDNDFISLDATQLSRPRSGDGTLPVINFLKPATGSKLIDKGIIAGLPFFGVAPDIGAFETVPPAPVVANQPPVVSISSPSKSTSFTSPATITIDAVASDPDGAIIKVEFFQGNVKIGERITTPYSITWKEVPEGTYSLTAVSTDNSNSKTVSAAVSVTVVKPAPTANKLPIVSIASPTKGSSFTAPATVTVDVNASDPDGSITKVELYNGTVKLYEKSAAPFSFTIKDLPPGSYELKAVATDNLKASSTSSSLALTVTPIYEARDYFNLYPNPNDGRFSIEFTSLLDADIFTVSVVDLIGNTVYREELSKDESTRQFDLSHLNSGIYVLMIAANQILLTQKFIKG